MNHSFDVDLAAQYGISEAILIHHFQHWIRYNQALSRNFIDGRTWTYQTRQEIAAHFPYMNEGSVRRLTEKLVRLKVLKTGNYNKSKMDKTLWYSFENEEMFTKGTFAKSNGKSANRDGEIAKAIPDTKPMSKPISKRQCLDNEETLPDKSEKRDIGKKSKYPLKKEQEPAFELLKSLQIEDLSIDTIKVWIRTFPFQKIKDAVYHLLNEKAKGTKFRASEAAFLRSVLNGKIKPITSANAKNEAFLKEFEALYDYYSFDRSISGKFITHKSSGKEIPLDLQESDFKRIILNLYHAERT